MKAIKYLVLLISISTLLASCEYDIDYKGELPDDKLVLTSFVEADSVISFIVHSSAKPGSYESYDGFKNKYIDFTSKIIYDANIDLYVNGALRETLTKTDDNWRYTFATIPQHNDKLEFKIKHKNFDEATGRANLSLVKPQLDSSIVFIQTGEDEYGNKYYRFVVYVEIRDNGGDNYYQITPNFVSGYSSDTNNYFDESSISLAEVLYENIQGVFIENPSSMQDGDNKFGVISNKKFKGGVYKLKLSFRMSYFDSNNDTSPKFLKGRLDVSSIEKQAYDYLFTLNRYNPGSFMSEPVIILDAIENGYGFVGGKNTLRGDYVNINFQ
ncbi:MAG: hypothetical protein PHN41_01865 [Bacteroidales bacterium]|jgi:hypothetical protein|nr:hypothetical protein [Bacteroidales bacterium]MDD4703103.1 hypothetical protein [Bacteroidales bacterium]MDX9798483.1 hypothetical protein [Bacteroidales bacterium]